MFDSVNWYNNVRIYSSLGYRTPVEYRINILKKCKQSSVKSKLAGKDMVLSYDSQNKLVKAGADSYTYDVENNRIASTQAGKTTSYVYDTIGSMTQMLSSQDSTGTMTKYVYGLGLLYEESKNAIAVYHYDLRGCTVALTDEQGTVTDRYHYDTYGQVSHTSGENDTSFLYNGRDGVVTDQNGLLYMRARYYSPELLRFINADVVKGSIADGDTLNRYAFVLGNPVSFVDPFGLSADLAANRYVEGKYSYSSVYESVGNYLLSIKGEQYAEIGHAVLDAAGMYPGFGIVPDAINTIWYLAEGKWGDAGLSALCMVPVIGEVAATGKFGMRAEKLAKAVYKWGDDVVKAVSKYGDDALEVASKYGGKALEKLAKSEVGSTAIEYGGKAWNKATEVGGRISNGATGCWKWFTGNADDGVRVCEEQAWKSGAKKSGSSSVILNLNREELFEKSSTHIFSDKHIKAGINDLGSSKEDIMKRALDVVENIDKKGALKEGATQIKTSINGNEAEIRVFIKDGKILNFDLFKGHSPRNMGNTIYY